LSRERALLSQNVLGYADLAQVVEQPRLCDGLGLRDSTPRREREALGQSRHALGMATGVLVLGLERVGEAEQTLQHGALHLPVALPEIHGIREGLLIGSPQLVVRAVGLLFSGPRDLVERPEVSRVREGLGQRYIGRHDRVSGTRASTSARRAKGENGLVRYSSAPAARPRARSDSWPAAVSMTMGMRASDGSLRSCRQTSKPSSLGMCTSSRTRSGMVCRATTSASAPSAASTTRTSASSSVKRTRSTMGGSSSTTRMVVMARCDCQRRARREIVV